MSIYSKGGVFVVYEKVLKYCEETGISVMEFEQKCDLANGTVGKWKSRNFNPRLETLQKIVKGTGIPIEQWIG